MTTQPERRETERRRAPRQKSLLRGTVYANNRRSAVDCVIRDISPHGARLVFPDSIALPDTLDLHIPQKDQTLRVHVIWRNGPDCGVAFAQAADAAPGEPAADLTVRVERLEAELAALKRVLKRLKADVEGDSDAA